MSSERGLESLASLLDEATRPLLEAAREEARFRYCYYLGVEHLFVALVKSKDAKFAQVLESIGADPKGVRDAVRRFAGVGGPEPPFAAPTQPTQRLQKVIRAAAGRARVRELETANEVDLVAAIFADRDASPTIVLSEAGIDLDGIVKSLTDGVPIVPVEAQGKKKVSGLGGVSILERFGRDLTRLAREGQLPDVIGREHELREVLRALCRQTKNAPLIIGEAGVGKTAVIEGLAHRIVAGEVPQNIAGKRIVEINMGSLIAGTKYRGEFEERIESLVRELRADRDVLLFIDEIHTLVGSGQFEGAAMDGADMLKAPLARGEITIIGATTPSEYSNSIEKDSALSRRFQVIRVEEPSPDDARRILEGRRDSLSRHHGFEIEPEAIRAAVELSVKYLPDRRLPDKALDLLDEACARLRVRTISVPAEDTVTEDLVAQTLAAKIGVPIARLTQDEQTRLLTMEGWLHERIIGQDEACVAVSEKIRLSRAGLRDPRKPVGVFFFLGPTGVGKTELAKALADFLMGSDRHIVRVDMSEYQEKHSISRLLGSPPGYVGSSEEGQLTRQLRQRPSSVVLFDEIEKAHADIWDLFLQIFDDGHLTDAQGRNVDCRHALFVMTSNIGADLWLKGHGREKVGFAAANGAELAGDEILARPAMDEVWKRLRKAFRPEFLNRIDEFIVFNPLGIRSLARIADLQFAALVERAGDRGVRVQASTTALEEVARRGYDPEQGARPIERAVEEHLARPLSRMLLAGEISAGQTLRIDVRDGTIVFEAVDDTAPEPVVEVKTSEENIALENEDTLDRLARESRTRPGTKWEGF